jgi:hypothetical protein
LPITSQAFVNPGSPSQVGIFTSSAISGGRIQIDPFAKLSAGGFTAGTSHSVQNDPRYLLARDLDGDGLDDLIVANNRSHTVSLERNDGAGGFTTERSLSFSQDQVITLERPVYLAFEDMNGDGRKDILVSWAANNLFTIFPGTPVLVRSAVRRPPARARGHWRGTSMARRFRRLLAARSRTGHVYSPTCRTPASS